MLDFGLFQLDPTVAWLLALLFIPVFLGGALSTIPRPRT